MNKEEFSNSISEENGRSPSFYETRGEDGFTVQQATEMSGLSEHTLRYYERVGLIEPVRRHSSSKHRRYSESDVAKITTLACLRAAGMPLDQMRRYFELVSGGTASAAELKALLEEQRIVLQERMRQMRKNFEYVEYKISYWQEIENGNEQKAKEMSKQFLSSIKSA